MDRKGLAGAFLPFVPVIIGIILKFSFFDKPTTDLAAHFKATYLTGIWIDFIVTAYISGIAWLLSRKAGQTVEGRMVALLLVAPLVCFVICVALAVGLGRQGFGEFVTLYLPALIAALSVALAGNALARA